MPHLFPGRPTERPTRGIGKPTGFVGADSSTIRTMSNNHVERQFAQWQDDGVPCWRCGLENVPPSVQCGKCGFPLSDEAARSLIQRRQKADEILDLVIRDPGVLEAIRGALAERGTTSRENGGGNGPPVDAAGDTCRSQGLLKASIASDSESSTTGCSSLPFDSPCEKRMVTRRVRQG